MNQPSSPVFLLDHLTLSVSMLALQIRPTIYAEHLRPCLSYYGKDINKFIWKTIFFFFFFCWKNTNYNLKIVRLLI
jgi:hypothetical protein